MQAAGGNFAADDDLGPAEKISLEIHEAHVTGLMNLVGRFEFFGQHLALRGPKPAHQARPFLRPGCPEVGFYNVRANSQSGVRGSLGAKSSSAMR
jgi:hypothetical protein